MSQPKCETDNIIVYDFTILLDGTFRHDGLSGVPKKPGDPILINNHKEDSIKLHVYDRTNFQQRHASEIFATSEEHISLRHGCNELTIKDQEHVIRGHYGLTVNDQSNSSHRDEGKDGELLIDEGCDFIINQDGSFSPTATVDKFWEQSILIRNDSEQDLIHTYKDKQAAQETAIFDSSYIKKGKITKLCIPKNAPQGNYQLTVFQHGDTGHDRRGANDGSIHVGSGGIGDPLSS